MSRYTAMLFRFKLQDSEQENSKLAAEVKRMQAMSLRHQFVEKKSGSWYFLVIQLSECFCLETETRRTILKS